MLDIDLLKFLIFSRRRQRNDQVLCKTCLPSTAATLPAVQTVD